MRVGSFSVLIPEGRETDSNHVCLAHGSVYRIRLGNQHSRKCDATVEVDGKEIGTWRIGPGSLITLERPAHDTGRFTFFESASGEAVQAGVNAVEVASRGLIRVTFRPEFLPPPVQHVNSVQRWKGGQGTGGGPQSYGDYMIGCGGGAMASNSLESEERTAGRKASGITGLTGTSGQQFSTVAPLHYDPLQEVTIYLRLVSGMPGVRPLTEMPRSSPIPSPVE